MNGLDIGNGLSLSMIGKPNGIIHIEACNKIYRLQTILRFDRQVDNVYTLFKWRDEDMLHLIIDMMPTSGEDIRCNGRRLIIDGVDIV